MKSTKKKYGGCKIRVESEETSDASRAARFKVECRQEERVKGRNGQKSTVDVSGALKRHLSGEKRPTDGLSEVIEVGYSDDE